MYLSDKQYKSWAMQLPNVPAQPRNGMIRTYDNSARTFSRPYSAKTVFFYKEGDSYFTVRRLTTPMGRTAIEHIEQLEHLGKYVASSSKSGRGIDLTAMERLQKVSSSPSFQQKLRLTRTLGLSIPAKQVFFVLNGKGRFHRELLNPLKLPTNEQLLKQVSEGLEVAIHHLYTAEGVIINKVEEIMALASPKVIACPRNERPFLQAPVQLPLIRPSRYAPRFIESDSSSNSNTTGSAGENGIEKPPRFTRTTMPPIRKGIRKATGAPKKRMFVQKSPEAKPRSGPRKEDLPLARRKRPPAVETYDTRKQRQRKPEDQDSGAGNSANSTTSGGSWNHWERDRAESMTEKKAEMIREEKRAANSEEDLIIEEESELEERAGHPNNDPRRVDSSGTADSAVGSANSPHSPLRKESVRSLRSSRNGEGTPAVYTPDSPHSGTSHTHRPATPHPVAVASGSEDEGEGEDEGDDERQPGVEHKDRNSTAGSNKEAQQQTDEEEQEAGLRHSESSSRANSTASQSGPTSAEHHAATKIQAAFRGYRTRKQLKVEFKDAESTEIPNVPWKEAQDDVEDYDDIRNDEGNSIKSLKNNMMTYTIEVKVGFRYGAETEADLFAVLHGDDGTSQRILLRQEFDWLLVPHPQFREDHAVRFHVESPYLGTLNRIVLGHSSTGYGAGVFIEYVLVTENAIESRQFLFFCNKWLDSGQVDGKIERTLNLSMFLYLSRALSESVHSRGRWEFIVHTRKDAQGGTTSNLVIVGYGLNGVSMTLIENDRMIADFNHNPLIQVDFGEIGDLYKVRFEVDGAGEKPNYFIEYIEVRDLDTDEKMAVSVNKWLMTNPQEDKKRYQAFREFPIYRAGVKPFPMTSYEGKLTLADMSLAEETRIHAQLIGTIGESGVFPITEVVSKDKKTYSYKVDCVHLGNITDVRILVDLPQFGYDVLEGLAVLQDLYDRHDLQISTGGQFFVSEMTVRETLHAPFRYILGVSSVREDPNNSQGPTFKMLSVKVIEGLATRKKASRSAKHDKKAEEMFVLSMSVEDGEHCQPPFVQICHKDGGPLQMTPNSPSPINGVLSYQLKTKGVGLAEKIRIGVEELEPGKNLVVQKMRLVETNSGTEVRFLIHNEFRDFEVLEVMCVYPDVAPRLSYQYVVHLHTHASKGFFRPYVNLVGSEGDTGFRAYPGLSEFPEDTVVQMEIEALGLGDLREAQIYVNGSELKYYEVSHDFPKTALYFLRLAHYKVQKMSWKFSLQVQCDSSKLSTWKATKKLSISKLKETITVPLKLEG